MEKTINLELTLDEITTLDEVLSHINGFDIRGYIARSHEDEVYVEPKILDNGANNISNIYKKIKGIKYE